MPREDVDLREDGFGPAQPYTNDTHTTDLNRTYGYAWIGQCLDIALMPRA